MATGADLFLAHPVDDRELRRALLRLDTLRPAALRASLLGAAGLASELAAGGIDARSHTSASSLLASFVRERPHVVVVGGREALATIRTVRMADGGDEVALVALGATEPGPSDAEALHAGADAILPIGAMRVDVVRGFARRVAARRARCLDVASGLPPRAELLDALHAKLNETRRRARAFTLAVLEIRDFDAMVAREGTGLGERLLGAVGQLLATRFRLEDARGRWRGGVLVAGFAETDAATMAPAVRRFQAEVAQLAFHGDAERLKIAVDVALASAPVDGDDLRALMLSAETRLEHAGRPPGGALVFG
jgi:diguanylate cyclase (GGDEF)-like protein